MKSNLKDNLYFNKEDNNLYKKIINHPIIIAILPGLLISIAYSIEIGYFHSLGINVNLIKIDFLNLLKVWIELILWGTIFLVFYCSSLLIIDLQIEKYLKPVLCKILKFVLLPLMYTIIFNIYISKYNATNYYKHFFIFILISFSAFIYLCYFLITRTNQFLKPFLKILNIICFIFFLNTSMYIQGIELGNNFKSGKIYFNGKKYQILRIYDNSILAATGKKNNYTSYIEIPKDNEFILKN